jgi:hypothetical protein
MRRLRRDEPLWEFMLRNHPPGEFQLMDVVSFFAIIVPCLLVAAVVCMLFPRIDGIYAAAPLLTFGLFWWVRLAYIRAGKD